MTPMATAGAVNFFVFCVCTFMKLVLFFVAVRNPVVYSSLILFYRLRKAQVLFFLPFLLQNYNPTQLKTGL